MVKDSKIIKFEVMIKKVSKYFCTGFFQDWEKKEDGSGYINPLEYFIDRKPDNEYMETIYLTAYSRSVFWLTNIKLTYNTAVSEILMSMMRYDISYRLQLVFWLIMIVAVDNDNYNHNLNVVSDVAYMLEIRDDSLKDLIMAVKGLLEGEDVSKLKYSTECVKKLFD